MLQELNILIDNGFTYDSDLPYCFEDKNDPAEYYIGCKENKAAIVALMQDEDSYLLTKEQLREMSATAKTKGIDHVTLFTNYGLELHSRYEGAKDVGFNEIKKLISDF